MHTNGISLNVVTDGEGESLGQESVISEDDLVNARVQNQGINAENKQSKK
jgi:hypothetical protein